MAKLNIVDITNKAAGEYDLPATAFVEKANGQAIFDSVIAESAGARQGTHSTLTKAEVRGGGKKPVPQKHTGNARQGSIRNPQWVGGGVVFGPKPNRNYTHKVNKKVCELAKKSVLGQKVKANDIVVLKDGVASCKTKDFANFIKLNKLTGMRVLFAFCAKDAKAVKAASNIKKVVAKLATQVSVTDMLKAKKVIFCAHGLDAFIGGKK